jgi:peroxiredoxin
MLARKPTKENQTMSTEQRPPIQPGEAAPQFVLPAVNREGTVSLDDFRGKSPLFIGLFRGLHCPFCRRQIVLLGSTQDKLRAMGVETLAVVNTPLERARLYFKYKPARVLLGADPDAATHRAFRLSPVQVIADPATSQWPLRITIAEVSQVRVNPTGELSGPTPVFEAMESLNAKDGFEATEVDQQIAAVHGMQGVGHFLIDRQGIVRWTHLEAGERMADLVTFPRDEQILEAARALVG